MKKPVIIVITIAILGLIGIYTKQPKTPTTAVSANTTTSTPASSTSQASPTGATATSSYQDGTYTGDSEDTPYGTVQIAAVVSGGKITDIKFLQMPSDEGNSRVVTSFSEGPLKQSAIAKQSAHVDFVSGATTTSEAYQQSLQAALDQAA